LPKKRTRLRRAKDEIVQSAKRWLETVDAAPPASAEELRKRVLEFVSLSHDTKELALFHVKPLLPFDSGSERILAYLRMFVGQEIEGEELEVVSGISEYARRVREWRGQVGFPIRHKGSGYVLERDQPDGEKAELWRTLNSIRRTSVAARDKMLALFRALPIGTPITTLQLRYVTDGKDMRRVRELRTQLGWRIMTRQTGMPQLKPGHYVLADPEPLEPHDRQIEPQIIVKVLQRDKTRCQKCGWHPSERVPGDPRQYLEIHHITWHVEGGENKSENLATLCNVDHKTVHNLKLDAGRFREWVSSPD
jgi:hypothetical protein